MLTIREREGCPIVGYTPDTEDLGPVVTVPLLSNAFYPMIYISYTTARTITYTMKGL